MWSETQGTVTCLQVEVSQELSRKPEAMRKGKNGSPLGSPGVWPTHFFLERLLASPAARERIAAVSRYTV
jgi:hypothetical protein